MTNEQLLERAKEARERAEKTTPGPWFCNINDLIGGWCVGTNAVTAAEGSNSSNVADLVLEVDG